MLEASGTDGQVQVNEINVSITRKGLFGRLMSIDGDGDEIIPILNIVSVGFIPCKLGVKGSIQFGVLDKDGKATVTSSNAGWIASVTSGTLKHAVMFPKNAQSDFEKIRDFVEERIKMNISKENNSSGLSTLSVADELLKLSQLRDSGVLTDAEFQSMKAKLI